MHSYQGHVDLLRHFRLATIKLYCLVMEAYVCECVVQCHYIRVEQVEVELVTTLLQVWQLNNHTTIAPIAVHHFVFINILRKCHS